jgi:hypothetical protein
MIQTQVSFKEMVSHSGEVSGFVIPEYSRKTLYRRTKSGDNRIIPSQHFTIFASSVEDKCIYEFEDGRKIYIKPLLDPKDERNEKVPAIMNSLEKGFKLLGSELLRYLDFRYNEDESRIKYNDFHLIVANKLPYLTPIILMNYGPSDQVVVGSLGDIFFDTCSDRIVNEDEAWAFVHDDIKPEMIGYSKFGKMLSNEEYKIESFSDYDDDIKLHIGEKMYIRSFLVNQIEGSWDFPCDRGYKNFVLSRLYKRLEYDVLSNSFKELTKLEQNRIHDFIAVDENEYFSDDIDLTNPEFKGFDRRPVSRLNQYDKMTIGKLSNNISNEYLDAVTSILQEHRYELKNAIAKILLRGYNDTDGMRVIDVPDQDTFDNLELYLARVSHIPLTSTIENGIKDLSDDTNFIHVVLLKTCDPTEDDYGPVYIPLFKIRSYKFTPMEDFDGNKLQETYIDYPKNVSFRTMVKYDTLKALTGFFSGMIPNISGRTPMTLDKRAAVQLSNNTLYISDFTKSTSITRWSVVTETDEYLIYGNINALDVGYMPEFIVDAVSIEKED